MEHFSSRTCSTSFTLSGSSGGLAFPGEWNVFFPVLEQDTRSCLEKTVRVILLIHSLISFSEFPIWPTDFSKLSTVNVEDEAVEDVEVSVVLEELSSVVAGLLFWHVPESSENFLFKDLREDLKSFTSLSRWSTLFSSLRLPLKNMKIKKHTKYKI